MTSNSIPFAPLAKRLACAVIASAGAWSATAVQAEEAFGPGSLYGAAAISILATGYECHGSPVCQQNRAGAKLFGGYRFTPNLAAEVGYYYLGSFKATQGPGAYAANEAVDRKLRNAGVSLGIDWSNELFQVLTQHVRFGLAVVRTDGKIVYGDNSTDNVKEYSTKPYLGLGLSYQFNPHVRLYSGYDVLRNKRNEHFHVLSLGLGIEN